MTASNSHIIYRRGAEAQGIHFHHRGDAEAQGLSSFATPLLRHFVTLALRILLVSCLMSSVSCLSAQEERSLAREGNKYFDKQKYADAEASYKKAIEKKSNFPEAIFNLGDAMYKQGRYDDAAKQFEMAAKLLTDTALKARSYHNLGNCSMEKKEYEDAIKAYKQALRLNPSDRDTKYNLAYANAKLKDKQQNKPDQKKQDQDKKDKQKKDQQNKDEKGDQKEKKGTGKELSKEQAEKLLEALKAEEQKTQEKMQKKTVKPQDAKLEKDW
jgi:Ca-activated chloride channel family protein